MSKDKEEETYDAKVRELVLKIQNSLEKDMVSMVRDNQDEDPLRARIYFLRNELAAQIVNVIQVNQTMNRLIDRVEGLADDLKELKRYVRKKGE